MTTSDPFQDLHDQLLSLSPAVQDLDTLFEPLLWLMSKLPSEAHAPLDAEEVIALTGAWDELVGFADKLRYSAAQDQNQTRQAGRGYWRQMMAIRYRQGYPTCAEEALCRMGVAVWHSLLINAVDGSAEERKAGEPLHAACASLMQEIAGLARLPEHRRSSAVGELLARHGANLVDLNGTWLMTRNGQHKLQPALG